MTCDPELYEYGSVYVEYCIYLRFKTNQLMQFDYTEMYAEMT